MSGSRHGFFWWPHNIAMSLAHKRPESLLTNSCFLEHLNIFSTSTPLATPGGLGKECNLPVHPWKILGETTLAPIPLSPLSPCISWWRQSPSQPVFTLWPLEFTSVLCLLNQYPLMNFARNSTTCPQLSMAKTIQPSTPLLLAHLSHLGSTTGWQARHSAFPTSHTSFQHGLCSWAQLIHFIRWD